jgi:hypothetical protein
MGDPTASSRCVVVGFLNDASEDEKHSKTERREKKDE